MGCRCLNAPLATLLNIQTNHLKTLCSQARFRVNRAIQQSALGVWVHAHHTFCRKVHQLEKVVGKNARRYTREHLFAWRELVEYYSRREVLVQQNAIRRAYIIAADVLRRWKMLEGGHIVVGVDQLDRAQVCNKVIVVRAVHSMEAHVVRMISHVSLRCLCVDDLYVSIRDHYLHVS